jgi:adenylate cyclase
MFAKRLAGSRAAIVRVPIWLKLTVAITCIIGVTIVVLSLVILDRQREGLRDQAVAIGTVSLNYFANDAAVPLIDDDLVRLNTLIREADTNPEIRYAAITGKDGVVRAHTQAARIGDILPELRQVGVPSQDAGVSQRLIRTTSGENILRLDKPVFYAGKWLGVAYVGVSLDFIDRQIRAERLTVLWLSFGIIAFGVAISVLIGVGFTRPISHLVAATREIGRGNFTHRLGTSRKDELGDLATAFNYMSEELRKKLLLQESFGRYVSPEVVRMVMSSEGDRWMKGVKGEATMLFADIRGYTAFAEDREPEETIESLNTYFMIASDSILAEGGYIDKFVGDAVLGVFGMPGERRDHAMRALRAALAMQEKLAAVAASGGNLLLDKVGISVHTGLVVAGNIGSEAKLDYTVVGDAVNLASRLNAVSEAGQVVMSSETLAAAGGGVSARPLPPQRVKGRREPVEIWLLDGLDERNVAKG